MPMRILSVFLSISSHTQFSKIIIKLLHCFNLFCLFFPSCQRTCRTHQNFKKNESYPPYIKSRRTMKIKKESNLLICRHQPYLIINISKKARSNPVDSV